MFPKKSTAAVKESAADRRDALAKQAQQRRNIRETIESIAIAFILAFLFRTFEAEAFVIPTGSMAPTLQGRHKDVDCPQCDFRYKSSASSEGLESSEVDIVEATCPMCRYTMSVDPNPDPVMLGDPEVQAGMKAETFNGDRILVGKFIYEFTEPKRWDVIVFKYPGQAKTNYIKRLVGLPNEELKLHEGNVYVRPRGSQEPFEIARKPPYKIRAMMQMVHDNDYLPADYVQKNWPLRWQLWPPRVAAEAGGWSEQRELVEEDSKEKVKQHFTINGQSDQAQWIRYQHYVPTHLDWNEMQRGPLPADYPVRPQLISDFYAYNTSMTRREARSPRDDHRAPKFGLHWVGDLMLESDVEVTSAQGEILLDLVKGGRHFTATIDVATGEATLGIEGIEDFAPRTQTSVRGPGTYKLGFSNIDDELILWLNGSPIPFDQPTTYTSSGPTIPTTEDLAPAGVGSRGAAIAIEGLRIYRDIYYIADLPTSHLSALTDYTNLQDPMLENMSRLGVAQFLAEPQRWSVFGERREVKYEMAADQFFALGDNSPFSQDSRLWSGGSYNGRPLEHFVDRKLLIGKALFIYWPHSWHRVPGTSIPFPYFPNFSDMGLVR